MPLYDFNNNNSGTVKSTQITIDVGQIPVYSTMITVVDSNVSTASKITAWQDATAFTGHPADEAEMDALVCSATPLNGSFNLFITAVPGPIVGTFLIDYIIT